MSVKTTIPITEARRRIFEIADKVQSPKSYYTLTEKGYPKAVIMSAEEFESWQETIAVQKLFPDLEEDIKRAREKAYLGKLGEYRMLESVLKKIKQKHAISNKAGAKSRKRTSQN